MNYNSKLPIIRKNFPLFLLYFYFIYPLNLSSMKYVLSIFFFKEKAPKEVVYILFGRTIVKKAKYINVYANIKFEHIRYIIYIHPCS